MSAKNFKEWPVLFYLWKHYWPYSSQDTLFRNLNRLVFSKLVILDRGDNNWDAIKPLYFIISKCFKFKFSSALLFALEVNIMDFVKSSEVFLIVSATGLNIFFIPSWNLYFPNLSCNFTAFTWLSNETISFRIFKSSLFFKTICFLIKMVSFLESILYIWFCFRYKYNILLDPFF